MNKKNIIILSVLGILVIASLVGYFLLENNSGVTKDSLKFKEEYESLNSEKNEDGSFKYTRLEISKDNKIIYLTYEELLNFTDNGTGTLYFGRPGCPWCRLLVPDMLAFAKENNINIYYYNIEADRAENNDRYKNILSIFGEYLPVDTVSQSEDDPAFDKDIKRMVLPQLFFMKDGKVKADLYLYQHEYLENKESDKMKQLLEEKYETISSCAVEEC